MKFKDALTFSLLCVFLIDQHKNRRFLILSYLECTPFNFSETHDAEKLLVRGGFPRSYLAENDQLSYDMNVYKHLFVFYLFY
jgi:predicted AAA+ superfamily ATPase